MANMSIYNAMMLLSQLNNMVVNNPFINHNLKHDISQAIDLAQGALKTIEDGKYMKTTLNSIYGKMVTAYADTDSVKKEPTDIDFKTLYENITMYYTKKDERYRYPLHAEHERVEYWYRDNTPLIAVVVWKLDTTETIKEISYHIKEN